MSNSKEIPVVILAGGQGKRMGELSEEKPKPLLEVDGKIILERIFDNIIEAFGSAEVIIALGHKGEQIQKLFGNKYRNVAITYAGDVRPLETRKRLLLATENINSSFLFLAGDIITQPDQLSKVVKAQEEDRGELLGVLSGAVDHTPALTHAIIKTKENSIVEMVFPPPGDWGNGDLREMHVACYSKHFLGILRDAPDNVIHISRIISDAIKQGKRFDALPYCKKWYHFVKPEDLITKIEYI